MAQINRRLYAAMALPGLCLLSSIADAQSCAPTYQYYGGNSTPAGLASNYGAYVNNIVEYNKQITCLNSNGASFSYNTDSKSYDAFLFFIGLSQVPVKDYKDTLVNVVNAQKAILGPNATDVDVARAALGKIVAARDEPGKSTDPALRDAEYALRNYIGAQVIKGNGGTTTLSDAYEDAVFQNPVATGAYNTWKAVSNTFGFGSVNQATPGNPNSPPGGFDAAVDAYIKGVTGQPLESIFDYRTPQPTGINQAIMPVPTPVTIPDSSAFYAANVSGGVFTQFDPAMADSFSLYLGYGPLISAFSIPVQPGLAGEFSLLIGSDAIRVAAGQAVDLTKYYPFGANTLELRNLCRASGCGTAPFLFDLKFASSGTTAFATSALVGATAAVPEPASWVMLLVGFGMVGAASRYRRRSTVTTFT